MSDRFELVRRLPGGAFGKITVFRDKLLNREIVRKSLRHPSEENHRRLIEEGENLGRLIDNEYVVNILGFNFESANPFLLLEYCKHGTLQEWVAVRRPWREVALALLHVARGLRGLHALDGIHRDIKPSNLLIGENEQGVRRFKLGDFGFGKIPSPTAHEMTRSRAGTEGYIDPTLSGEDDFDWRADIYSLGRTFREILTGSKDKGIFPFMAAPRELHDLLDEMTDDNRWGRPSALDVCRRVKQLLQPAVPVRPTVQVTLPAPSAPARQETGGGRLLAVAAATVIAILWSSSNSWDGDAGRYRDSKGRFRSGRFD